MSDTERSGKRSWLASSFPTFIGIARWRVWRVGATIVLLLLLLTAILSVAGNVYYGGKLRGELRALKEAGRPVTWADPPWPSVPEAENAAPLYEAAARVVWAHRAGTRTSLRVRAGAAPDSRHPFGYDDQAWDDPQVIACLAELVNQDERALALTRQATRRPLYRSATANSDPIAAEFPQLKDARSLAAFLGSAAVVASHEGHQAEALERLRMGYVLGRHLSREASLISELVVCSIDARLARGAEYVIARGALSDREARALAEELSRLHYFSFSEHAWSTERVAGIDLFARARRNRLRAVMLPEPPGTGERLLWWAYAYPLRPILYADELTFLRLMALRAETAVVPPFERAQQPPLAKRDASALPFWLHPVTRTVMPSSARALKQVDLAQTQRDLARAAIGLELYRQERGTYPTGLEELRRSGWVVPHDIFAGRDFIYRRRGNAYVLYSVGFDQKDSGGRQITWLARDRPTRAKRARYGDEGDIVWGQ